MTAAASTLRCPSCGASAAEGATACGYCGSSLATVACASCFGTMFVGSKFCQRCGAESARELLDVETIDCPGCKGDMQAIKVGSNTLRECTGCAGVWLEGTSFEQICATREPRALALSMLHAPPAEARGAALPKVRYLPCPGCKKVMNRVNFAKSSGIVIDVCKSHGVWLDPGELQRLIGFIDAGGVEKSQAKERERMAEQERRLRNLENTTAISTQYRQETTPYSQERAAGDLIEFGAVVLVDLLRDVLRGGK